MGRFRDGICSWTVTAFFLGMQGTAAAVVDLARFSRLLDAGVLVRKTRRGSLDNFGLCGRLASHEGGGMLGRGSGAMTGADKRAASSELFSGVLQPSRTSSAPSEMGRAKSGDGGLTSCAGLLRTEEANKPDSGGPGGSKRAVTAVQLSARSLFIIQ